MVLNVSCHLNVKIIDDIVNTLMYLTQLQSFCQSFFNKRIKKQFGKIYDQTVIKNGKASEKLQF